LKAFCDILKEWPVHFITGIKQMLARKNLQNIDRGGDV
jgi:hypothetical protein